MPPYLLPHTFFFVRFIHCLSNASVDSVNLFFLRTMRTLLCRVFGDYLSCLERCDGEPDLGNCCWTVSRLATPVHV